MLSLATFVFIIVCQCQRLTTNCWQEHIETSIRPLVWSDINFLATTDTHAWYSGHKNQFTYNGDWGDFVNFVHTAKIQAAERGQDLLIVDLGDRHDGSGLLDLLVPNGINSTAVFIHQDYDIITLGNHELYEWENLKMEYDTVAPRYEGYVCSNVEFRDNHKWKQIGRRYKFFETPVNKFKVLSFGFLFDFKRFNEGTRVTPIKEVVDSEGWFDEVLRSHKPDIIVVAGHLPILHDWEELHYLHKHIRKYHENIPIQYFGGHSHIRDFSVLDASSTALQAGRFCETLGFALVNMLKKGLDVRDRFHRRYIDFNRRLFAFHAGCDNHEECLNHKHGTQVKELINLIRDELGLNEILGKVKTSNFYVDYVPLNHPKSLFKLMTEKVLKALPGNPNRIIIINTGLIRYDLYRGDYTLDTQFIVLPFLNDWMSVRLPKHIALKVAPKLNEQDYIAQKTTSNHLLKPPHQWFANRVDHQKSNDAQHVLLSTFGKPNRLSKGYVTTDDFGSDGDDTPHRAVVNFPIPNVVQLTQLDTEAEEIDLVFYSFLVPNIKHALKDLGVAEFDPKFYSNVHLGSLLTDYVRDGNLE